jgi:pimeloyl-ACP methyl ester carboxylesterase
MTTMSIRDVRLFVEVVGRGYPLALMHGGPGADHWTMLPFRQLADRFTVVFYDHRCNGRSVGAPVTSQPREGTCEAPACSAIRPGRDPLIPPLALIERPPGRRPHHGHARRLPADLRRVV